LKVKSLLDLSKTRPAFVNVPFALLATLLLIVIVPVLTITPLLFTSALIVKVPVEAIVKIPPVATFNFPNLLLALGPTTINSPLTIISPPFSIIILAYSPVPFILSVFPEAIVNVSPELILNVSFVTIVKSPFNV